MKFELSLANERVKDDIDTEFSVVQANRTARKASYKVYDHFLFDAPCPKFAIRAQTLTCCDSVYENTLVPIRDTINLMLPILQNDISFIAGAHLTVASLHESLIQ